MSKVTFPRMGDGTFGPSVPTPVPTSPGGFIASLIIGAIVGVAGKALTEHLTTPKKSKY